MRHAELWILNEREIMHETITYATQSMLTYLSLLYLQKKLDFTLKVIGGDISTIPGLSDAIEVRLNSTI